MRQHGVDFEALLANFKHISTHGSHTTGGGSSPWLSSTFASPTSVGIVRQLYLFYLILTSAIGLVLCQYTVDNLFQWLNGGTIYALQLMPEAKLLTESKGTPDHQSFANNYFCLSVGFCITLGLSLIYGLLCSMHQKQGGRL